MDNDYAVQTYIEVLTGTKKRFPRNFWTEDEGMGYSYSAAITRYLIEDVLKWDNEMLKEKISCKVFFKYKLKGMLCGIYGDSVFKALENAYPGKYNEWELACTPRNFWNIDTAREATVWLFKQHLNLDDEKIIQNISRKVFVENGLDTMLHVVFNNNATKAIKNAFPELF